MIQQYQNLKKFLEENKPQSTQFNKMNPTDVGNQYKKFMFELINQIFNYSNQRIRDLIIKESYVNI